jgi:hypothetical protein
MTAVISKRLVGAGTSVRGNRALHRLHFLILSEPARAPNVRLLCHQARHRTHSRTCTPLSCPARDGNKLRYSVRTLRMLTYSCLSLRRSPSVNQRQQGISTLFQASSPVWEPSPTMEHGIQEKMPQTDKPPPGADLIWRLTSLRRACCNLETR